MTIKNKLDEELKSIVGDVEKSEFYKVITSPTTDPKLVASAMKHIYLSIYQYQPHVTEATFTAVGRLPKQSEKLIRELILQQVEEVEHADMAGRDYERLGGKPELIDGQMLPECAAVAGICRFLGEHCPPASYLGFMYVFEALTPIMASRAQSVMDQSNYESSAREFVDLHATEDIRHTDMLLSAILDLVEVVPDAEKDILWGLNVFRRVYPMPVWQAAFERARSEM